MASESEDVSGPSGLAAFQKWRLLNESLRSQTDRMEVLRLSMTIREHFIAGWKRHLTSVGQLSCATMMQYMSDGWSRKVWRTTTRTLENGVQLKSCGLRKNEYLLQRGLLKSKFPDGIRACMLPCAPRPLLDGKTSWEMLGAMSEFAKPLRWSTAGPCVTFICLDGLHFSPVLRLAQARNRLMYDAARAAPELGSDWHQPGRTSLDMLALTDFTIGMRCQSHIMSLATHWGLQPWSSKEILEDLHISIKGLRTGGQGMLDKASAFVQAKLVFKEPVLDGEVFQCRAQVWRFLVQSAPLVDQYVSSGFWFDPATDELCLSNELAENPRVHDIAISLVMAMFHWIDFSETRWCGVGSCCRSFFGGLFAGADFCWRMCKDDSTVSMELLGQYKRARESFELRYYAGMACFVPLLSEAASLLLLQDDRFLRNNRQVLQAMNDEMKYLESVRPGVWAFFTLHIGGDSSPEQFRSDVFLAARRVMAFAYKDAFSMLEELPWKLTQGDIGENIDTLMAASSSSEVGEEFAAQLYEALHCGMSRSAASSTLEVMLNFF